MLKQKIKPIATKLGFYLSKPPLSAWIVVFVAYMIVAYIVCFILPESLRFSYSNNKSCIRQTIIAPDIYQQSNSVNIAIKLAGGLKIGGLYIFSSQTCFTLLSAPSSGDFKLALKPLGLPVFVNNYVITVGDKPSASATTLQPIAASKPVTFLLSQTDKLFKYSLKINNLSIDCSVSELSIACPIDNLDLRQGSIYPYKLSQSFNKSSNEVVVGSLTLLPAVTITQSSINPNETVFGAPKVFTFNTGRPIVSAAVKLEKTNGDQITIVQSITAATNTTITTTVDSNLEREATYRLTVISVTDSDGSTLNSPYVVNFHTSDGPKVTSVNIGSSVVSPNAKVVVSFDQSIKPTQDISKFASISGGNAAISYNANQITFQLANLPACSPFTLNIAQGLLSQFDIVSSSSWSYSSRIDCGQSSVIGYSVQGRPIVAYTYGGGSTTILFTGGIHGNEQSSKNTMLAWATYLDSNAYKIPAGKKVVVIPGLNPDGLARSSRYNINNVNLDRNFPSSNWAANIDTSTGIIINGGGAAPLSEPETKAIANFTTNLQPRLEVSFHSQGSLVGANQYGDSVNIANQYTMSVGYQSMVGIAEETMGYSITGEYEDWMGEKYAIPAILIELPSNSGNYLQAHLSALWKMVGE